MARRPVRTSHYRNPRFFDVVRQTIVFDSPIRAYTHVVRDLQEVDGQIYGWVRHQGGDWAVKRCTGVLWEGQNAWQPTEEFGPSGASRLRAGLPGAKQVRPAQVQSEPAGDALQTFRGPGR